MGRKSGLTKTDSRGPEILHKHCQAHSQEVMTLSKGVLIFEGMTVGFLPGDLSISIDPTGKTESKAILSTAYNVVPIWLRIAHDNAVQAKAASDRITQEWSNDNDRNRELLVTELKCCLQVFVACGVALDALYDQLRPFAGLTESDIAAWRKNKTGRAKQIAEVIRRVFNPNRVVFKQFKQNLSDILKYRDMAVHPSVELKRSCSRSDVPVGVDWKFTLYRSNNSEACFTSTMNMFYYLYKHPCSNKTANTCIENIMAALQQLEVVTLVHSKNGDLA